MRRRIYVVAAFIEDDGKVLLDRRAKDTHLAGHWEFPGGKKEAGETDEQALRRELKEELGVASQLISPEPIASIVHAYEDFDVELVLYAAEILGKPEAVDVAEIGWFALSKLRSLPMPPADRPLIDRILAYHENTGQIQAHGKSIS
jgi:8-oxo-dGTP diphosphatase